MVGVGLGPLDGGSDAMSAFVMNDGRRPTRGIVEMRRNDGTGEETGNQQQQAGSPHPCLSAEHVESA